MRWRAEPYTGEIPGPDEARKNLEKKAFKG